MHENISKFTYKDFTIKSGRFAAMPADQIELYQDEEVYGIEIPADSLESIHGDDENMLLSYDDLGLGIGLRFKHPISQFQGAQYEKWDCGYICGMTLIYY